jgi:GNAT superfamily N-acetyltransferase
MTIRQDAGATIRRQQDPPVWEFGDLVIRRYDAGDHEHVLALHHTALTEVGLRPGDGVYYDDDFPRLAEIYLDGGGEFLVAEPATVAGAGLCVIAMGALRRVDAETAEMVRLRVHPHVQRRGYGAAIVHALEERAVELGYRLLRGDTTALQWPALSLYRRFGWREVRREDVHGIVTIYGEKALAPPDGVSQDPPPG